MDKETDSNLRGRESESPPKKLNTNDCCFLCLKIVDFKAEVGNEEISLQQQTKESISLKCVQRHLQIKTDNLSNPLTAHKSCLSTPIENLEVDLCLNCANIVKILSKSILSLEKAQLEVNYWLTQMKQEISESSTKPELVHNYPKRMTSDPETLVQLAFVDNLRKEIVKKSLIATKTIQEKTSPAGPQQEPIKMPAAETIHSSGDNRRGPGKKTVVTVINIKNRNCVGNYSKDDSLNRSNKQKRTGVSLSGSQEVNHFESTHLNKQYRCDFCNKVFNHVSGLSRHKKTCKDSQEKRLAEQIERESDPNYKFPCSICGKKFPRKITLEKHRDAVHLNLRNFECNICKKTFKTKGCLITHRNGVHLKSRRKTCKICKEDFGYIPKYALKEHEEICRKEITIKTEPEEMLSESE